MSTTGRLKKLLFNSLTKLLQTQSGHKKGFATANPKSAYQNKTLCSCPKSTPFTWPEVLDNMTRTELQLGTATEEKKCASGPKWYFKMFYWSNADLQIFFFQKEDTKGLKLKTKQAFSQSGVT